MSDHDETDDLSPEELAEAQAFAEKVDDLVLGKEFPRLGDAQEQELLRNSAIIRAAHHEVELDSGRQASLIEDAMRSAIPGSAEMKDDGKVHSLDAARAKRRRNWSVGITGLVVAAAIALFWFRIPDKSEPGQGAGGAGPVATLTPLPASQQSRPSDALVGRIAPEQSGMTSSRVDQIYSDRLSGYRALQYSRLAGKR